MRASVAIRSAFLRAFEFDLQSVLRLLRAFDGGAPPDLNCPENVEGHQRERDEHQRQRTQRHDAKATRFFFVGQRTRRRVRPQNKAGVSETAQHQKPHGGGQHSPAQVTRGQRRFAAREAVPLPHCRAADGQKENAAQRGENVTGDLIVHEKTATSRFLPLILTLRLFNPEKKGAKW